MRCGSGASRSDVAIELAAFKLLSLMLLVYEALSY